VVTETVAEFRRSRLEALAKRYGGNSPLGRALGFRDGAYIGQMLRGERAISEKLIEKAETLQGCKGWFNQSGVVPLPSAPAPAAPRNRTDVIQAGLIELGAALTEIDSIRRDAVGAMLSGMAKHPEDADSITGHILALIALKGKIAA